MKRVYISLLYYSGEQTTIADHLRQVVVPIWSKEECDASDYGNKRLTGNMMCAGFQNGGKGILHERIFSSNIIYNLKKKIAIFYV